VRAEGIGAAGPPVAPDAPSGQSSTRYKGLHGFPLAMTRCLPSGSGSDRHDADGHAMVKFGPRATVIGSLPT